MSKIPEEINRSHTDLLATLQVRGLSVLFSDGGCHDSNTGGLDVTGMPTVL